MPTDDLAWRGAVDRALGPLHRAVAHDLRTPLNALRLNLALVRRTLDGEPASTGRWLDVVEKESRRLEDLLGSLLELTAAAGASARICAGDLGTVLSRGEPVLECLARHRGVELVLDPARARGAWPEGALRRAVAAAVAVATTAAPGGGALRVASSQVPDGGRLALSGGSLPPPEELEPLVAPLGGRATADGDEVILVLPSMEETS